jgi:hypothetical protein
MLTMTSWCAIIFIKGSRWAAPGGGETVATRRKSREESGRLPKATGDVLRSRALALLLQGETVQGTAMKLGVNPSTVSIWRSEPAFAAKLEEAQGEILDAQEVASELVKLALDPETPIRERVQAMRDVLDRVGAGAPAKVEVAAARPYIEVNEDVIRRSVELLRSDVAAGRRAADTEDDAPGGATH